MDEAGIFKRNFSEERSARRNIITSGGRNIFHEIYGLSAGY